MTNFRTVPLSHRPHKYFFVDFFAPSLGPGFHPHPPSFGHRFLAKGLGAGMWFFIFYRARQDGAALIVSFVSDISRS